MSNKFCLISNDVETTSILNNKLSDKTGKFVLHQGMPRLLELYEKYNIKSTFFFTGYIAKLFPDVVKMVLPYGHEVASHGLTHLPNQAFDLLSLEEQVHHLKKSKEILEDISGKEVISFRAPATRVNYNTILALEESGYKIDSSISAQRFDMFLSTGSIMKLNHLFAPRKPYFADKDNIFKKGNSTIFEIPISALGFPYIGTVMRIFPNLNRLIRNLLHFESIYTQKPFVFLTHPNEFIDEYIEREEIVNRRSNIISYFLKDIIRYNLKQKNLGEKALPIFEKELKFIKQKNYNFVTFKEYLEVTQKADLVKVK